MTTKKLLPLKAARAAHKKAIQKDIKNINKFVEKYGQKELDDIVRKITLTSKKNGGIVKKKSK